MPLTDKDFAKLARMQTLCTQLEADAGTLKAFINKLKNIEATRSELTQAYQEDWLTLTESGELSDTQYQQLNNMVANGGYSILAQDTIWDALSDVHAYYHKLLGMLANSLNVTLTDLE